MDFPLVKTDLNARTQPFQIGLDVAHASPPTAAYVGVDDTLWIGTATQLGNATLTVNARLLMPDGVIKLNQWSIRVLTQRNMAYTPFSLPECFILSITATCSFVGGPNGNLFAELLISRAAPGFFNSAQVLAQGYINANQPICWPGGVNSTSIDVGGCLRTITGTTPAAGVNFSETVPANARWRLHAVFWQLLTSATVANRVTHFQIISGGIIIFDTVPTAAQAAGANSEYSVGSNITPTSGNLNVYMLGLPTYLLLSAGNSFQSAVAAIQVGDQLSAPQYLVEEWLIP